ncbi:MAG: succinate dehydrogenase/fumarate reductase iron-sulfur subunit [Candidatus Micrarchaeia archaeon]
MRTSKYFLSFYVAMGALPILFFVFLISAYFYFAFLKIILFLLAVDLIVFSILGIVEIYYRTEKTNISKVKVKTPYNNLKVNIKDYTLEIKRFDSEKNIQFTTNHKVDVNNFSSVLDALLEVKEKQDNTLSIRYSCRMGICGSCGMVIDGKPSLACETNFIELCKDKKVVKVEPMESHPILKDLVTDFTEFIDKHKEVEPHLVRNNKIEQMSGRSPYEQSSAQINEFLPYSYCIMCGLCMDACPVVNTNKEFIGPQALSQAYRYYKDSRDQMESRITIVDKLTGLWGCEFAGACSKACPKGVDPASAIQLLKAATAEEYLGIKKEVEKNEK